jgi:hypothetical protein
MREKGKRETHLGHGANMNDILIGIGRGGERMKRKRKKKGEGRKC